ncbi:hypothetical protein [Bordetella tumulicola]|uniref:hypothetical protein n=1 Tax=Bordetella tumulicola TaxID=1649133 RepID=UPI0039EE5FF6
MAQRPDYDSAWKDALSAYFPEFMLMLRPDTHAHIDWTHPPKFMDKELQALMRSTARGRRHVDKLVSVRMLDGQDKMLLIHVEVQTRCDSTFSARMFDYHIRLKSKYPGDRLLNLVVLTGRSGSRGEDRAVRASNLMSYAYQDEGCGLCFTFPVVWLESWRPRMVELHELAPRNPFAVIVLVQLEASALRHGHDRLARKIELVRHLEQWGFTRDNRRTLFRVIDAMLYLPDDLEPVFEAAVIQIEEEHQMTYVTSIERVRLKRERAEGLEEGREQGLQKGKITGAAELLTTLITSKFGMLPDWAHARIVEADEVTLNQWALRILQAERLEDVFA